MTMDLSIFVAAQNRRRGFGKNWIATVPGRNWFAYFRFYRPTEPYFDGSDFERL